MRPAAALLLAVVELASVSATTRAGDHRPPVEATRPAAGLRPFELSFRRPTHRGILNQAIARWVGERLVAAGPPSGHDVGIHVRSGRVILTGRVRSASDREWFATTAKECPGVSSVENRLRIEPPAPAVAEKPGRPRL